MKYWKPAVEFWVRFALFVSFNPLLWLRCAVATIALGDSELAQKLHDWAHRDPSDYTTWLWNALSLTEWFHKYAFGEATHLDELTDSVDSP